MLLLITTYIENHIKNLAVSRANKYGEFRALFLGILLRFSH